MRVSSNSWIPGFFAFTSDLSRYVVMIMLNETLLIIVVVLYVEQRIILCSFACVINRISLDEK